MRALERRLADAERRTPALLRYLAAKRELDIFLASLSEGEFDCLARALEDGVDLDKLTEPTRDMAAEAVGLALKVATERMFC